jgi:hypothetical protein
MQSLGTAVILLGMAIVILAQIVGAILVFRVSILKGVLSLIVPGYFLFALRREGLYGRVVGAWVVGIVGLAVGTIMLS